MTRRTRIKDIAERLGLSPATVSRALAESPLVAKETRDRVREVADELHYRPNVSARNLRTKRSMAVLMVVRDVVNPFYLEILKGVEATARAAGYAVLMGNAENDPDREDEYFDMLYDGHADGMILMTGKWPRRHRNAVEAGGLPVVVALEMIEGSRLPHLQIDNEGAAAEAVRHLIEIGHTRIAHVTGPLPEVMSVKRMAGYIRAMKEAGLTLPDDYVVKGNFSLHSGMAAARFLMALEEPPTALFAANDEMALGAIHEMRALGFDVPGDISVVGFDNLFLSDVFYPPLTTVAQPRAEIGRRAMTLLLDILAGGPPPAEPVIVPTSLKIRGTTAPLKTRTDQKQGV
ncbi:LacI family repressor for deo operon, udp, cdd, tsx, nupC, and nupG [Rhodobium orientis]|uniref:LacI family transcriptional regulator n=1 Tax=Rhodobium orientis TaxID=34017 RepID=A0A327JG15_9HYPH|nr:LacI family DNA-binding transcriptional regulator [Rhodobium orientis]MBB4303862.1 LacI family repressor for deo operon, udp, cdd, tsx, nupC, and nupG [Rhodobium orientis]MBK5947979.1 LacI family transcriptional regulator [Rhodobium orientis]RAI25340.1 LacI family transcriptional regulator [Rhodobium orientis]